MRKCHGRELWRERKKEAGYEDGLILSCGPSSTEYDIHICTLYYTYTLFNVHCRAYSTLYSYD
jgi:hypothetical protein